MYNTGKYAYVAVGLYILNYFILLTLLIKVQYQPDQFIYSIMGTANQKAGYCKFTVSKRHLIHNVVYAVYTFPKNWRYTRAVNYK